MLLPALAELQDRAHETAMTAARRAHYVAHGAAVTPGYRQAAMMMRHEAESAASTLEWAVEESRRIAWAWAHLPLVRPLVDVDIYEHCRDRLARHQRALELARDLESWARHYQRLNDGPGASGAWLICDVLRRHASKLRREAAAAVAPHGADYYRRAGLEWLAAEARRNA